MKALKTTASALLLLFISTTAMADELAISYGLGIAESAVFSAAETKTFNIAYRQHLFQPFYLAYEGGMWLDSSGNPYRHSSAFFALSPGFLIDLKGLEIRNAYGVAYITDTDMYLGGHIQFHGELYVGVRDSNGYGIGFKYHHFSSAGIYTPNVGRDFILLELSSRFY